jgi:hypothetical protein
MRLSIGSKLATWWEGNQVAFGLITPGAISTAILCSHFEIVATSMLETLQLRSWLRTEILYHRTLIGAILADRDRVLEVTICFLAIGWRGPLNERAVSVVWNHTWRTELRR